VSPGFMATRHESLIAFSLLTFVIHCSHRLECDTQQWLEIVVVSIVVSWTLIWAQILHSSYIGVTQRCMQQASSDVIVE
jgi:hypothetical protein